MSEEEKIKHMVPKAIGREGQGLQIPESLQPVALYIQGMIADARSSLQNLQDGSVLNEENATLDADFIQ